MELRDDLELDSTVVTDQLNVGRVGEGRTILTQFPGFWYEQPRA